jgi:hypothetical protein
LLALDVRIRGKLLTELLEVLRLVRGREQKPLHRRVDDYAGGEVLKKPKSKILNPKKPKKPKNPK